MTAKQRRRHDLLVWSLRQYDQALTAAQLADSLSVKNLYDDEIPWAHRKAVTEFRRLRQDARIAACRAYTRDP